MSHICTCSIYCYNDINFTYLYMRTNYLRHLANTFSGVGLDFFFWGGGATPNRIG